MSTETIVLFSIISAFYHLPIISELCLLFILLSSIILTYFLFHYNIPIAWLSDIKTTFWLNSNMLPSSSSKKENEIKKQLAPAEVFFQKSSSGLIRMSTDGLISCFNPAAIKILGFTCEEEILSTNYISNTYRFGENIKILVENIKKGTDFSFEEIWKTPSGNIVFLKEHYIISRTKEQVFLDVFLEDVTDKKKNERALKINEEKFKIIIDQLQVGIYRTLATGEIIFANLHLAKMLGCSSSEELKGRTLGSFSAAPEAYEKLINKHISLHHTSFSYEHVFLKKDGMPIWIQEKSNLLYDTSNELIFCEGTVQEITEKKNAEQELNRLFAAINQISESIIITDLDGKIVYTNPAFEKNTQYSNKEIIGKKISVLKSSQHSNEFYKKLWNTILGGNNWSGRIINKKKDGSIYEEFVVISPIKNQEGKIINFVSVKRDITEERKLEQQVNQSQKLQAIGTLAGGIAHDFNNILMGMQIYTEILLKKIPEESQEHELLQKIYSAENRAKELTRQILSFSRQSGDGRGPLQVHIIVKEAIKLFSATLPEYISLEQKIKDCGQINGSPTQIHQIVMNLCTNAHHAIEGNGTITIELEKLDSIEYPDGSKMKNNNDWVLLKVQDTGCGIEKKIQDRVFDPFFTTKTVGHGVGLGLATVHGIVKQYNGEIFFSSEIGKGTVFYIYLPAL